MAPKRQSAAGGKDEDRVRVVVRIRPPVRKDEKFGEGSEALQYDKEKNLLFLIPKEEDKEKSADPKQFVFDKVLWKDSQQHDAWEAAGMPVVNAVMEGYTGCVMCYGAPPPGARLAAIWPRRPSTPRAGGRWGGIPACPRLTGCARLAGAGRSPAMRAPVGPPLGERGRWAYRRLLRGPPPYARFASPLLRAVSDSARVAACERGRRLADAAPTLPFRPPAGANTPLDPQARPVRASRSRWRTSRRGRRA